MLLSSATASLVADRLPSAATLLDLGLHRLKDLGRPEHIWQLRHPDLELSFPALRSIDQFRHNLPVQLTPLIGRAEEVHEVVDLTGGERLVTLTGSAGVGKTRLALAVAAEAIEAYPGGIWWVDLAVVRDLDAIGRAVLAAIGARDHPHELVAEAVAAAIGDAPVLVVLDNCEHLVAGCADLVASLLAANLSVSMLTTSREPLGVPGEVSWRVPSMGDDAVTLFVDRARRARPTFALTDENSTAVADICQRLDGIPLAIELAASRCRQMSVDRIGRELDDRFRLLTGGARTAMARQQTLAASIDWSHDLLDEAERVAFRRLGVFAGPFPLEAAEAIVAAPGDLDPAEAFDLVIRLTDRSLVVAGESAQGETTFRLLESLRAYALDHARHAGEVSELRDAHARWWADWLAPVGDFPTDDVLEQFVAFHADLKAALDWSTHEPSLGLRVLCSVARAWEATGAAGDAMDAVDVLLVDEHGERFGAEWLEAACRSIQLWYDARGLDGYGGLRERIARCCRTLGRRVLLGAERAADRVAGSTGASHRPRPRPR